MNVDTSDRREQRKFGIVMGVAVVVLGLARWALHRGGPPMALFYVAGVLLALGLLAPIVLRPFMVVWYKFALALNWVMTGVLLTLAFVLMITPVRLIIRLFGDDPLNRAWDPEAVTYWEDPDDQPADLRSYFNQF